MKILIIDDEIEVATLLAESVKEQGHETIVTHDGREALALLAQHRPDAIFLELFLPEMSGIEVLRHIRRTDSGVPVIVVTGRARPEELEEARRLGVTEVIEKPIVLKHFDEALARLKRGGPPNTG